MSPRRVAGLLTVALLHAPQAWAHSPFPGIKGLYSGFLHPLTQPAPLMLLIAISLLLSDRPESERRKAASALAIASALGLLAALLTVATDLPLLMSAMAVAASVPVLLARDLPNHATALGCLAGGFVLGLGCAPDTGQLRDVIITSFGVWLGLLYLSVLFAGGTIALSRKLPARYSDTGRRVASSWLIAVAGLYGALSLLPALP